MTQKFKILVTRKWPKKVEESLVTTFDTTLNVEDKPLSESELIEAMKSYDALLPTVTDPITDKIISTPDRKVKIILSADALIEKLCKVTKLESEFKRTESRINEMQQEKYIQMEHRTWQIM